MQQRHFAPRKERINLYTSNSSISIPGMSFLARNETRYELDNPIKATLNMYTNNKINMVPI